MISLSSPGVSHTLPSPQAPRGSTISPCSPAFENFPATKRIFIDFETRSVADLRSVGAWNYSRDPSTEILCLSIKIDDRQTVTWHRGQPDTSVKLVFAAVRTPGNNTEIWAHNAAFERYIWQHICAPRLGWPEIPFENWRCSAALAARWGLPRSLEGACQAIRLSHQKDMAGHRLMLQMCKPRSNRGGRVTWWEDTARLIRLGEYCARDVDAGAALVDALPPLEPEESAVWRWTEELNDRGIFCDRQLVSGSIKIAEQYDAAGVEELARVTRGQVRSVKQTQKMGGWLAAHGCRIPNLSKETVRDTLASGGLRPEARRALELRVELSKSSVSKFIKMLAQMGRDDDRIRGHLFYAGAHTLRWTSRAVQTQNIPSCKWPDPLDLSTTIAAAQTANAAYFDAVTPGGMPHLVKLLRPAFCAPLGKTFVVADYASIEARVLMWLVGAEQLRVYNEGRCLYCEMASKIYARPITKADVAERDIGKRAILGLGYGMGWGKFLATCAKYGATVSEEFARRVVDSYRGWITAVPRFWKLIENAFIACLAGKTYPLARGMFFERVGPDVDLILPHGGRFRYHEPTLLDRETPWGEVRPQIHYWTEGSQTRRWERTHTYGGKLTENVVQRLARDLLRDASLRLAVKFPQFVPVLTLHDELVAEVDENIAEEMIAAYWAEMAQPSDWAKGCPIAVDGWVGRNYKK